MPDVTYETRMPISAERLFEWHTRRAAFERLVPPWESVQLEQFEGVEDGARAVLRMSVGPVHPKWVAEHHDVEPGHGFRDVQVKGPFSRWEHTHHMASEDGGSRLRDHVDYAVPLGGLGEAAAGRMVRRRLDRMFAYRHRITQQDLAAHAHYTPDRRLHVAISGASGLIGSHLVAFLRAGGHEVLRLVREPSDENDAVYWNHRKKEIELDRLEGLDAVIHLAGENIFALQWSEAKKMAIYNSRVRGTQFLAEQLTTLNRPPEAFLSASAVGIYGHRGDNVLTEEADLAERGFLAAVCRDWEDAARRAADGGIRTVQLRIGIVMTPRGGALAVMRPLFMLGLGGYVGEPDQYLPWIALDDVLQSIYHLCTSDLDGPINLTAPHAVTARGLAQTLGHVLRRPAVLRVPSGPARFILGSTADELALSSARVQPSRLDNDGYTFLYPELEPALRHLLGRSNDTSLPVLATAQAPSP